VQFLHSCLLRDLSQMEGALQSVISKRDIMNNVGLRGSSYSRGDPEIDVLLRVLQHQQLIDPTSSYQDFSISVEGILALETMNKTGGQFTQGFVAMWFDPTLEAAWTNGFDPAIRKAGYRPFRVDKKDYVGGITDQIIAEIRRSRFIVVDYTEQVGGVYFEAGFALGLGLTVIPTCRQDQISELHFDIRHLNTLPWQQPLDLAENLTKRIVAVVGAGPL
jgi:hypothetical protein